MIPLVMSGSCDVRATDADTPILGVASAVSCPCEYCTSGSLWKLLSTPW